MPICQFLPQGSQRSIHTGNNSKKGILVFYILRKESRELKPWILLIRSLISCPYEQVQAIALQTLTSVIRDSNSESNNTFLVFFIGELLNDIFWTIKQALKVYHYSFQNLSFSTLNYILNF